MGRPREGEAAFAFKSPWFGIVAKALNGLAWIDTDVGIRFCFGVTLVPQSLRVERIIPGTVALTC